LTLARTVRMSDDLSPVEQARAARWAADWLIGAGFNTGAGGFVVKALFDHADTLAPSETVESLRAERDEALAEMEEVEAAWRQEQFMHQKAWATIRNLQAEMAETQTDLHKANAEVYRLRAAIPVADAAWGRSKSDRTWHKGADEPEGVNRVTDIGGDEWGRANGKWSHPHAGPSRSWANLLNAYGPLTEVISR